MSCLKKIRADFSSPSLAQGKKRFLDVLLFVVISYFPLQNQRLAAAGYLFVGGIVSDYILP